MTDSQAPERLPEQNKKNIQGLSTKRLARLIFKAEVPEEFIRALPPQSVYMVLKQNGLASSAELVETATIEQCRTLLDFDLWDKDDFNEKNFWEWLSLSDQDNSLRPLQKFLKFVDFKLIGLMISRHVESITFDDPSDNPPGPGFFTPDNGYTWLSINIEDGTKQFLMGKLLALIFETDADIFYRLMAVPGVATPASLQEEAFSDKVKRLSAEGVPDMEYAFELNSPMNESSAIAAIKAGKPKEKVIDIVPVEPMIYDSSIVQPLSSLIAQVPSRDEFESELTLIMNAAVVKWGIKFYEYHDVVALSERVKGCINIGLESALELTETNILDAFKCLSLQGLYRLGLSKLFALRGEAEEIKKRSADSMPEKKAEVLAAATMPFPEIPRFLKFQQTFYTEEPSEQKQSSPAEKAFFENKSGTDQGKPREYELEAIEKLSEIGVIKKYLNNTSRQ